MYTPTSDGALSGKPGEDAGLEGYSPPLGYEDLTPECNKILNTWLANCAFAQKVEWSLRKSARKKYGPGSGVRTFVGQILQPPP